MHAGAGDLPRLVDDLASGRLAGVPVRDYVLLLQESIEGGPHDLQAFARPRNLSTFFSPVRRSPSRVSGNAIVSTRPLTMPSVIALPRERQPRAAVTASIAVAGRRLVVVNAHFENRVTWWRGGLLSDSARGRQADALLRVIAPGAPAIVGGDFNTWLGAREPAWQKLAARFPDTPGPPFEPTFRDRLVLDHLFFDLPDDWTARRIVARETYGSDHRPVVGLIVRRSG
jgi:endonuclease/exonuclease/phosphatase family metal-dependent hydrolase